MAKEKSTDDERARQMLAQEAARIMVEHGVRNFGAAKSKAAERLGLNTRGALPRNIEVEAAIVEHLQLFGRETHVDFLGELRTMAVAAMQLLHEFSPRLVGPVLSGTADESSAINLHVFSDTVEAVAGFLADSNLHYRTYERRLKTHRGRGAVPESIPGLQFEYGEALIEATVFPIDGIRQAPISPVNGKPMQRASIGIVAAMIRAEPAADLPPGMSD